MWLLTISHCLCFALGVMVCRYFLRAITAQSPSAFPRASTAQSPSAPALLPAAAAPSPPSAAPLSAPFESAHARASFAVLLAGTDYVRARLDDDGWYVSPKVRELAWLLAQLQRLLPAAMSGDPLWDRTRVRQRLHELDLEMGPDSWWRKSQKIDELNSASPHRPPLPVIPALTEIYDTTFVAAQARRHKRRERRLQARAPRAERQALGAGDVPPAHSVRLANPGDSW